MKSRTCANGIIQKACTDQEDVRIPTSAADIVLLTSVIDAKEE